MLKGFVDNCTHQPTPTEYIVATMITFAIHGYEGVDPAFEFGPLQAEFERRGVPCMIIRSPRTKTRTPNQDRAKIMVDALRDIQSDVALIGISNQGLFMPLVAAARPIKRIVFINAAIPRPGRSFWETARKEHVFASLPAWLLAWMAPGMHEAYPLDDLPKMKYVYITAERDESVRPEWQLRAAREYLHVEPVVIADAGHGDIVLNHLSEIVDAALLQPQKRLPESRVRTSFRRSRSASQGLISFVISHFIPLITYFAFRPHATSDTEALAIAWFIPLAWTLGSSAWYRRLDVIGLIGIAVYGLALFASVFLGVGPLPLKLHHAAVAVVVGLVCLVSVAIRRPVFMLLTQGVMKAAGGDAPATAAAVATSNPGKKLRLLTLVIGIACLADAALQTMLAITLSTAGFLEAQIVMHVAAPACIIAGVLLYLRFKQ